MLKTMIAGGALMIASGVASAAPFLPPTAPDARIVLVREGCGPGFHRDFYGACVPNRGFYGRPVRPPPPCPRFYHRDPDPARPICYPNL